MKFITISAGVIMPLLVGLLHHEVRDAMSAGRWPTVLGMVLGFNGLFAVFGGILAAVFAVKARPMAAWTSVTIAVVLSGGLSVSSGPIKERALKLSQESDAQKISVWNQKHHGEVLLTLQKCDRLKVKTWRSVGQQTFETTVPGLSFVGSVENKSAEKIVAVVVELKVVNKEKKQTIVSHRLALPLEIFPTATLAIDRTFRPVGFEDDAVVDELHRAATQLGENFAQDYEFIAAIPLSLADIDLKKSFKVAAHFYSELNAKNGVR